MIGKGGGSIGKWGTLMSGGDFIPPLDDTYWLGSDTMGWKGLKMPDLKLYQLDANTLALQNIAGGTYKNMKIGSLEVNGDILPEADNTRDLGSVAKSFRNVYFETAIYSGAVAGSWNPDTDNAYDLGTDAKRWRDIVLSRTMRSGSTNTNVMNIAANDTTFLTFTTGATDSCLVSNITMTGTWLVSGSVTLPAYTLGGTITLNAQSLSGQLVHAPLALSGAPGTTGALAFFNMASQTFTDSSTAIGGTATSKAFFTIQAPTLAATNANVTTTNIGTMYIAAPLRGANELVPSSYLWSLWTGGNLKVGGTNIMLGTTVNMTASAFGSFAGTIFYDSTSSGLTSIAVANMAIIGSGSICGDTDTDTRTVAFKVRDTGVGLVSVAQMIGAADPYFVLGRSDSGVSTNSVTDSVYFLATAGTTNVSANFGLGIPFYLSNDAHESEKRGSINYVLKTATNGAEAAQFDFTTMNAGALLVRFSVGCLGIGFFATAPVAQQTGIAAQKINYAAGDLDTEGEIITAFNTTNTAINALRTALNNYGLTTVV